MNGKHISETQVRRVWKNRTEIGNLLQKRSGHDHCHELIHKVSSKLAQKFDRERDIDVYEPPPCLMLTTLK